MGNAFTNLGTGLGVGIASLAGLGDAANPLTRKREAIANLKDQTQQTFNTGTLLALKNGTDIEKQLYVLLNNKQKEMQTFVEFNNELLWESIAEDNLFIVLLFVLLLVVIFFDLFGK